MKKTILFYSALLLTVAGSAQTAVQSQQKAAGMAQVQKDAASVKAKGSGNAAAAVQTDATSRAEGKAKAELAAKKEVIATRKEQLETTSQAKEDKLASKEIGANASASSDAQVNTGENKVHASGNGSLNTGTTVSLNKVKDNTIEVNKEVATHIENNTNTITAVGTKKAADVNAAVQTKASGAVRQTGSAAAGTTTKVVTAIKANPAPVKIKAHTSAAAGIKLR
jgi:hypothetical protein